MARRPLYTDYPRPILWLIPGGTVELAGSSVLVEPFYLSKLPITNEQFRAFDPDHTAALISPADRDVALGIDWQQADAYCRWYAEVSRKPMRLPGAHEWVHACGGGERPQDGDDLLAGGPGLLRVGGHDPRIPADLQRTNGFGLQGMLGGVWEWTSEAAQADGGNATPGEALRVLRGGSFRTELADLRCGLHRAVRATHRSDDVGFRVAKSLR
jgi:formylglycine-generating enzyme required for sulfatase activity